MEKFNQLLKNSQAENGPFTQLPLKLNQAIFSGLSKPVDLAKASIINKNWNSFTLNKLTESKAELVKQTIHLLSDTNRARKLPIDEIEKHLNFLIKSGYKFESLKALQDITCDELKRLLNDSYYCHDEAGNLDQYEALKSLLHHKFKLAGYINADLIDILRDAMCSNEQKFNVLITLCAIKILLEGYFKVSSVQEEFNLANKYLATLEEEPGELQFHTQDGQGYLGLVLLDEIIKNFDAKNQTLLATEAAKQWLSENNYIHDDEFVNTQAPKFSM